MLPKITIITAVYNSVNTLEQTISSVVHQTYPNLEYVIIDGGSTDGTVDIIKKYEQEITYWISEKDTGIYDAWNKGVNVSTGNYIEFLGADDCLCSNDIIERIEKEIDSDTDILSCPIYTVDERYCKEAITGNDHCIKFFGAMPPMPGVFARKELYIKYPLDIHYKIASDYKFILSCYRDNTVKIKYIDIPVVYFSLDGASSIQDDLTTKESVEIANQFGIKYPPEKINANLSEKCFRSFKFSLKEILRFFHVLSWVKSNIIYRIQRGVFWEKHHCENRICRWCNRNIDLQ